MVRAVCRCRCVAAGTGSRVGARLAPAAYGPCTRNKPTRCGPCCMNCPPVPVCPPHAGTRTMPSAVVSAFATGSETGGIDRPRRWPAAPSGHASWRVCSRTSLMDLRVMGLASSSSPHVPTGYGTDRDPAQPARAAGWRGGGLLAWSVVMAASPQLALLAQLGLSRVREFDADRLAAELTGDPQGWRPRWRKSSGSAALACLAVAGMGQSRPSWLRTHPATQERISRLLTLAPGPASALPLHAPISCRNPL